MIALLVWMVVHSTGPLETVGGTRPLSSVTEIQASPGDVPPFLEVGEELEYLVSYSFFDIGTIRFRVEGKERRGNRVVYRASTIIDSNPSLSWLVNVHIRFYGLMDSSLYSHSWRGEDSTSEKVMVRTMDFDYAGNRLCLTKGERLPGGTSSTMSFDTVQIDGPSQDGMSLFFYARQFVRTQQKVEVPTYIDSTRGVTIIDFQNRTEEMEIDAVSYPVATVYFEGEAGFVGVFGLTGGFEGWFSKDMARVPIVARMKVLLGSVKIQLTKWKRGDWQPPRFQE